MLQKIMYPNHSAVTLLYIVNYIFFVALMVYKINISHMLLYF